MTSEQVLNSLKSWAERGGNAVLERMAFADMFKGACLMKVMLMFVLSVFEWKLGVTSKPTKIYNARESLAHGMVEEVTVRATYFLKFSISLFANEKRTRRELEEI